MKIYAVRHAHTNYNQWYRLNGNPGVDVHLSKKGKQQAEEISEKLKDVPFEHIFISEMPRTRETANIINKHHNKKMTVEPRFNDIDTGLEGFPVMWWWMRLRWAKDPANVVFGKGESLISSHKRVEEAITDLTKHSYKTILVVAHRHTIHSFQEYFDGARGPAENAAVHIFDTDKS